ncbi:MAG: GAF domain-containing protein [Cyclobacteriaceae bacterium]|nr:GAF domain-containing protein [Cyclobacteriaceae bacterium]
MNSLAVNEYHPEDNKAEKLTLYHETLIQLHRHPVLYQSDLQKIYQLICLTTSQTLSVNRVSIWSLNRQNRSLVRRFLYEKDGMTDEIVELFQKDYPAYFSAFQSKPFIQANDACNDPDTFEFSETYLKPLAIYSMLDCPILIDRTIIGVICCEHQYNYRHWQPEDALFVQSIANLLAIVHQNLRIVQLLKQIRNQNHQALEKSREIERLNEKLFAVNQQLTQANEHLEEAVRQRTMELEKQNLQLTEYAFINSHLLRAPLARVLGLLQLIQLEALPLRDKQLVDALFTSAHELDTVVRNISEMLYSGNPISRDDVKQMIERNMPSEK